MFRIYQAFLSQLTQLGHLCRLISGEGENCQFDSPATVANRITIGLGLFYDKRPAGISDRARRRRNFINRWPAIVLR